MSYLNTFEARRVTEDLGATWYGGIRASNPESDALRAMEEGRDPELVKSVVDQLERSREVLRPYLGRIAWGATPKLVLNENNEWGEVYVATEYTGGWYWHAEGTIKDVEAHVVRIRGYDGRFGEELDSFKPGQSLCRYDFRIGVVLDSLTTLNMGLQRPPSMPKPDEALIPINGFQVYPAMGRLAGRSAPEYQ